MVQLTLQGMSKHSASLLPIWLHLLQLFGIINQEMQIIPAVMRTSKRCSGIRTLVLRAFPQFQRSLMLYAHPANPLSNKSQRKFGRK
ncbi:uncharacterized protein EI90DRAFT_3063651 [Cantharellus anzutake]|uniref:uncharacterized protein n=1 Tax=Cantharellus anzutake TaxID=1750568 RepID=UPI001908F137|nr:uncharacterized protein EI90DRAFT_3063651 [Cantharellus anzutake]KAF8328809.1 hypothetical protein EI90DRAFT_3063651 [Cantharellus anzutake]